MHKIFFQEHAMRTKVTDNGVLIPKGWFEGIDEVEIQKTQNMIIVVPVQADAPILDLSKQPIVLDVEDASLHHDRYLYDR
jgi:hypothetical protein